VNIEEATNMTGTWLVMPLLLLLLIMIIIIIIIIFVGAATQRGSWSNHS
jgi:uncharacterized membrane protein